VCSSDLRQNAANITIIFGNPPYSVGQKSANDNAKNKSYPKLNDAIANSYAALSLAVNKNALYDSYIRAFRYATDRLRGGDGIICFVSNGSWLDGNSTAGFRKSLEKEFAKIFVFNLRGNQRTSGELSRKEGGKIFGSGSRTPVTITLLVKRQNYEGKAEIFYSDIGDYLKREEKLKILAERKTFCNMELATIEPNEHGDWITGRNEAFQNFIPLASEKKYDTDAQSFFIVNSYGMLTSRDTWVYNFSRSSLAESMKTMIGFYNAQVGNEKPNYNSSKIAWSSSLQGHHKRGEKATFDETKIITSLYRPFTKQSLYYGEKIIHRRGQFDDFFPNDETKNLIIATCSIGDNKDFSCVIANGFIDVHCIGTSQCFPLYYYEPTTPTNKKSALSGQIDLSGQATETTYTRKDGISDFILSQAHTRYGRQITKEDIFYYVYGFLHSPSYRTTFVDDLKKSLPRIPLVESAADFWAFSKAGRDLANLHLNYENEPPPKGISVSGDRSNLRVEKMRYPRKNEKDTIIYNPYIIIENILPKAYEYIVNGKPAIEWVMERYQIKTDKASGITNDPNLYATENGNPEYILNLLLSVIAVSIKTVEIVEKLPNID
jgi:predicted helicase